MNTKKAAAAALAAVTVLGATSVAAGQDAKTTTKVKAALNVGQETPRPRGTKVGASGLFTATLSGTTLTWRLTWKQLSGPATAAHIHMAPRGKPGPVIVPLCGPCTAPETGSATLTTAQVAMIRRAGGLYVNVHTARNPGGEIRGQLTRTR
jgi:CHRD domain-containing protein